MALAALVATVGALASISKITFDLEEDTGLQWLFRARGPLAPPPEAVVVRYDGDALSRLKELAEVPASQWPKPLADCAPGGIPGLQNVTSLDRVPRPVMTCLVQELTNRGAAVIAFDVSFRPDPNREAGIPALAEAIQSHGRVILLDLAQRQFGGAVQIERFDKPHPTLARAAIATAAFPLPRSSAQIHQFWAYNDVLPLATQMPLRALEVLALPGLSELVRATEPPPRAEMPPRERLEHFTSWFRAQVATADGGITKGEFARLRPTDAFAVQALARAYRGPDYYYLNFYGPAGTFPTFSAADLLLHDADQLPVPDLHGRVVFVGSQELAIPQAKDSFQTAFGSAEGVDLGGVEILATAFANLLHGNTLWGLREWVRVGLVAVLGFAFTLASCFGMVWRGLAVTLSLAAGYAAVAFACFTLANLWLPVVVPLLGLLPLTIGIGQLVHYVGAARWLGVYAPRRVSRHLLQGGDFDVGGAQMREVSVMLTDIVGFTTLAEQTSPAAVTAFVNRHFTMLTGCVEDEGGTVAQFIGDSVMSFWGAPDFQPDHAARACRAAMAIGRALEDENARRAEQGLAPVRMRIGINTGTVTAGNVGAPGRSNYGIVGDTVNTTQRIEQLAKVLCSDQPTVAVLVSARTRDQAGSTFTFLEAGSHEVRGRREPVKIYRLQAGLPAARGSEAPPPAVPIVADVAPGRA